MPDVVGEPREGGLADTDGHVGACRQEALREEGLPPSNVLALGQWICALRACPQVEVGEHGEARLVGGVAAQLDQGGHAGQTVEHVERDRADVGGAVVGDNQLSSVCRQFDAGERGVRQPADHEVDLQIPAVGLEHDGDIGDGDVGIGRQRRGRCEQQPLGGECLQRGQHPSPPELQLDVESGSDASGGDHEPAP